MPAWTKGQLGEAKYAELVLLARMDLRFRARAIEREILITKLDIPSEMGCDEDEEKEEIAINKIESLQFELTTFLEISRGLSE